MAEREEENRVPGQKRLVRRGHLLLSGCHAVGATGISIQPIPRSAVGRLVGTELYPDAGEAVAIFRSRGGNGERRSWSRLNAGEDAATVAARRAGTKVRRYCAANRLNRLGTLTYRDAGCHEVAVLRADLGVFFRRLRRALGGYAMPYLWVGEWHPGGHGLHAHFAVGQFIGRSYVQECWSHGFIKMKLIGDVPVPITPLAEARATAGYLSKYVAKAFGDSPALGLHRYEVAQGFMPEVVEFQG